MGRFIGSLFSTVANYRIGRQDTREASSRVFFEGVEHQLLVM